MRNNLWAIVLVVAGLLPVLAGEARGGLNNGFETDYVYVIKAPDNSFANPGSVHAVNEVDGTEVAVFLPKGSAGSLTFTGTGKNDARLFVAKEADLSGDGVIDDISIAEINAGGVTVNSVNLSTFIPGSVGAGAVPILGGIRYHALSDTLFLSLNPNQNSDSTATVYEFDLGLTSRIHTYVGPSLPSSDFRQPNIAINARNGMLYLISRNLGGNMTRGSLIAFNTAGRPVAGTSSTFTTLINGVAYSAGDTRYTRPHTVIYRKRAGTGSDDTVVICMSPSTSSVPSLEFWLDTTAHPSGNPAYLALRGYPILVARGWNGQQDEFTGDVWLGALRGGYHVIRSDDMTASYQVRLNNVYVPWEDAASPPFVPCNTPVVTITSPASGSVHPVNTPVSFAGNYSDNAGGTHTAQWTLDGITLPGAVDESTGAVTGTYAFTSAGVYMFTLSVDGCGGTGTADTVEGEPAMVVIYDPDGGFVTGGGWIDSPAGAYTADLTMTGKANFGFVSKYQKGATIPTGETEFQFKAGNLNFHSSVYEWMVIAGARAQYKGTGTVNGSGNYRFMLTAIDGQVDGGGGTDKFRIRIWNDTGLVYDNLMNAADSDDPTTVIGGGSIVVHK